MSKEASRPRLGRGLSSLISTSALAPPADPVGPDAAYQPVRLSQAVGAEHVAVGTVEIAVDDISPNPYQPRREFDPQELTELADSIVQQGILQPLVVVRPSSPEAPTPFVLVAGERRLRAAKLAQLNKVPCVIRHASPQQMLEWALVENIQRSNLNPIDRAGAYRQYIDRFSLTQSQAAERLGQPRATVANYLRLLELCEDIQSMLCTGQLSFGHAKVLAGLAGQPARQLELARKVLQASLSVRQLEQIVEAGPASVGRAPAALERRPKPPYLRDLEERLTAAVGTRVLVQPGRAKHAGRIVVDFYSLDDFDRIAGRLGLAADGVASPG